MLRIIKAIKRRINGFKNYLLEAHKLRFLEPKNTNPNELVAHLLIVKKLEYIKIAQICVRSFLYFHPTSKIIVHTDNSTYTKSRRKLKRHNVVVINDCDANTPWQISKINIAVNLESKNSLLIDADLKWNGPVFLTGKPTFFVKEFCFMNDSKYAEIFATGEWKRYLNFSMKNTSIFSPGNKPLSNLEKDFSYSIKQEFDGLVSQSNLDLKVKEELSRISEQVALSLLFEDSMCEFVKETDAQFDGQVVESSYFGATGTRFGLLGVTSKRR